MIYLSFNFGKNTMAKENFTKRQRDIIQYILDDMTNKEIAQKLNVSIKTVEKDKTIIYDLTNTNSALSLYKWVQVHNLISL